MYRVKNKKGIIKKTFNVFNKKRKRHTNPHRTRWNGTKRVATPDGQTTPMKISHDWGSSFGLAGRGPLAV